MSSQVHLYNDMQRQVTFHNNTANGHNKYSGAFRALTPSRVWGFQATEIMGGQGRRGPHV